MAAIDTLVSAFDWWPSDAQMKYSYVEWVRYGHSGMMPEEFFNCAEACLFMFFHCGFIKRWEERPGLIPEGSFDRKAVHHFCESKQYMGGMIVFEGKHMEKDSVWLSDQMTTVAIRPTVTYWGGNKRGAAFWRDPHRYLYCPLRCWVVEPRDPYNKLHRRSRWTGARILEHPSRAPLTTEEERFGRKYDNTPWNEETDNVDTDGHIPRLIRAEAKGEKQFKAMLASRPPQIVIASKQPTPELALVDQFIQAMEPLPEPMELALVQREAGPPLEEPSELEIDRMVASFIKD